MKRTWKFLRDLYGEVSEDRVTHMAASLAYYAVFSLPGILILVVSVASLFVEGPEIQERLGKEVGKLFGPNGADKLLEILNNAKRSDEGGLASIFGTLLVVIGATGFVAQLQDSLNVCWGTTYKSEGGFLRILFKRLLSLTMILTLTFLLLISFAVNTFLGSADEGYLARLLGDNVQYLVMALSLASAFFFQFLLFAAIYKLLPNRTLRWGNVWVGAMITSVLFTLGKSGLEFYIINKEVGSAYGAAASLVILLTWVYFTTLLLLLGAEITKVYSGLHDRPLGET